MGTPGLIQVGQKTLVATSSDIRNAGLNLGSDIDPSAIAGDIRTLESACRRLHLGITESPNQIYEAIALQSAVGASRAQAEATEAAAHQVCTNLLAGQTVEQAATPLAAINGSLRLTALGASIIAYCPQFLPALNAAVSPG